MSKKCSNLKQKKRKELIEIDLFSFQCQKSTSRDQMVILQDSARILQKLPILQDLAEKWLSCKTWQKNGYIARSARKMVILQDSGKFVPVELSSYWLSFMQNISF